MDIDVDVNEVVMLYQSGLSMQKVADAVGIKSAGSVAHILKKNGVKARSNKQNSRKYTLDHNYFNVVDSESKAYWLGFLQMDGYLLTNDYSVGLSLAEKDIDHVEKFKNEISATYPVRTYLSSGYSNSPYARLVVKSEQMWNDLNRLGVTPRKTKTSKPIVVSENLERHYVRGLIDGDGSIKIGKQSKSGYRGDFVSASKPMADYIASVFDCNVRLDANKNVWYSEFTLTLENLDYLYGNATVYLQRKYDRAIRARQRLCSAS